MPPTLVTCLHVTATFHELLVDFRLSVKFCESINAFNPDCNTGMGVLTVTLYIRTGALGACLCVRCDKRMGRHHLVGAVPPLWSCLQTFPLGSPALPLTSMSSCSGLLELASRLLQTSQLGCLEEEWDDLPEASSIYLGHRSPG